MSRGLDRRVAAVALPILALAPLFALRLHEAQPGLLYPDGYQYLVMAKGIAAHGRPLLTLGVGGDTLLPSPDAAAKPVFPALVALVHLFGFAWLTAARAVNALAEAAVVVLSAQVARRLTGSWVAATVAAVACLASRQLAFWGAFAGPDGLGQALALASTLALLARRPRSGGVLAALAVLARPEIALLTVAAATVGFARAGLRRATLSAVTSFIVALAAILGLLRPPLAALPAQSVAMAMLAAVVAGGLFLVASGPRRAALAPILTGVVVAGGLVVTLAGRAPGIEHWAQNDWPLLLAGAGGWALAVATGRLRTAASALVLAAGLLTLAYVLKNPGADRYLALLTPLVAILASLPAAAVTVVQRRASALALASLLGATLALGALPTRAEDAFPTVARQLRALNFPPMPIVTAAPDAYGVLVPERSVRIARPGATGLIIVDGAMRAYEPTLRFSARSVAMLDPGAGFVSSDGNVDRRPVRVEIGRIDGRASGALASGP
jgi:hypothetical protein